MHFTFFYSYLYSSPDFFRSVFLKQLHLTKIKRIFDLMPREEIEANNGIVKLGRCHAIRKIILFFLPLFFILHFQRNNC